MGSKQARTDAPARQELSPDLIVEHLRNIAKARHAARDELDELETELHKTVILAFNRGVTVRPIMDATGYSKSRCYQIRDGRR